MCHARASSHVERTGSFVRPQLPHIFSHVQTAPPGAGILYAFNDPLRKLSHGNDGIIFTPARDPYRPYTCPSLLKWGRPSHRTQRTARSAPLPARVPCPVAASTPRHC